MPLTTQEHEELMHMGGTRGGPVPFSRATAQIANAGGMNGLTRMNDWLISECRRRGLDRIDELLAGDRLAALLANPNIGHLAAVELETAVFDGLGVVGAVPFSASAAEYADWSARQRRTTPAPLPQPDPRDQERGRDHARVHTEGKLATGLPPLDSQRMAREVGLPEHQIRGRSAEVANVRAYKPLTPASRKWAPRGDTTQRYLLAQQYPGDPLRDPYGVVGAHQQQQDTFRDVDNGRR